MTATATKLLTGKRVLVTGASRGLGRELCRQFAADGARVAFTYTRDEEGAKATTDAISAAGGEAKAIRCSVLDVPATEAMLRDLDKAWGGVDVLVNNAGVSQNLPLALLEEEDWDRVMDVNVKGAFLTSKAVLRGMIRRLPKPAGPHVAPPAGTGAVILNMGSIAGVRMLEAPIHYAASKAALRGFTEALAKEVARYGIRVICLAPGVLDEGLGRNLPEHKLADYLKHNAMGRVGRLDEVAKLAAFLVSDANGYMTGETVVIDGGV